MNLPDTISRTAMAQALRDLTGIDPNIIREVRMTPSAVTVEYYVTDEDGRVQRTADGLGTQTNEVRIEVTS